MKTKDKNLLIYLITPLIITSLFSSSCCFNLNKILEPVEEPTVEFSEETNTSPTAEIDITQEGSDGYYYEKGNPIFLSGSNSIDPDKDELTFVWKIGDGEEILEEETSYVFDNVGEYIIELTVSDGIFSDTTSKSIRIIEPTGLIIPLKEHRGSIEIEYIIENKGPGDLVNVQCRVEVPKTRLPFQIVEECSTNSKNVEELIDDMGNLIYKFSLKDIAEGESASAKVSCDVTIYEFSYKDYSDVSVTTYDPDDKDLELYTKSEKYIDSDSPAIIEAATSIVGDETNPYKIAEKLYNFVTGKLDYDYERLEEIGTYLEKVDASEILKRDKGICMDYSILYTALLRAACIPAKYITGVPIYTIACEDSKESITDHAWVEIKLPGYGWIPIDVTSEKEFLSHNFSLNLKTYEGDRQALSITIDGCPWSPTGYFYYWFDVEPEVIFEYFYRVSGIEYEDIEMVAENAFLGKVYNLLDEYNAAINHVNVYHKQEWIFNDPEEIALEVTFLVKLQELSSKLKKFSYPQSYAGDRNNLIKISEEICIYKEAQIGYMRNNNYDGNIDSHNKFTDAVDSLFDYYNYMNDAYNSKY